MAVPSREQQYQGTIQSSITVLLQKKGDSSTSWRNAKACHKYLLQLLPLPEVGAGPTAVGSLDAGGAFFTNGDKKRFITDSRKEPIPIPYAVDTDYPSTASALQVPCNTRKFDCRP